MWIASFSPVSYSFSDSSVNMLEPPSKDCLGKEKFSSLLVAKPQLQEGLLEYTKAGKMRNQLIIFRSESGTRCSKNTLLIHMLPV